MKFLSACSSGEPAGSAAAADPKANDRKVAQTNFSYLCILHRRWIDGNKVGTYAEYGERMELETPRDDGQSTSVVFEREPAAIQGILSAEGTFTLFGRANPTAEMAPILQYQRPILRNGYYQSISQEFSVPGITNESYQIQCN